jgi:transcriptional regulator of acetoin/glycerol metabolism
MTQQAKKRFPLLDAHVLSEKFSDPDLVDRIFDHILSLLPELRTHEGDLKGTIRREFGGTEQYVRSEAVERRQRDIEVKVRRMFDGRNASHIARVLGISRATVYRCLKQSGVEDPAA